MSFYFGNQPYVLPGGCLMYYQAVALYITRRLPTHRILMKLYHCYEFMYQITVTPLH